MYYYHNRIQSIDLHFGSYLYKRPNKETQVYHRRDSHKYLKKVVQDLRSQGSEIFYQDETWFNANYTMEYIWQLENNSNDTL